MEHKRGILQNVQDYLLTQLYFLMQLGKKTRDHTGFKQYEGDGA